MGAGAAVGTGAPAPACGASGQRRPGRPDQAGGRRPRASAVSGGPARAPVLSVGLSAPRPPHPARAIDAGLGAGYSAAPPGVRPLRPEQPRAAGQRRPGPAGRRPRRLPACLPACRGHSHLTSSLLYSCSAAPCWVMVAAGPRRPNRRCSPPRRPPAHAPARPAPGRVTAPAPLAAHRVSSSRARAQFGVIAARLAERL